MREKNSKRYGSKHSTGIFNVMKVYQGGQDLTEILMYCVYYRYIQEVEVITREILTIKFVQTKA